LVGEEIKGDQGERFQGRGLAQLSPLAPFGRRVQNAAQLIQFLLDGRLRAFRISDALESFEGLLLPFSRQEPCRRLGQVEQGQGHRRQRDKGAQDGHYRPVEHGAQGVANQNAHRNVQRGQ